MKTSLHMYPSGPQEHVCPDEFDKLYLTKYIELMRRLLKFIFGDFKQSQGVVFKNEISMHQSCFDKFN